MWHRDLRPFLELRGEGLRLRVGNWRRGVRGDLVRVEPVTASHRPADRLAGWGGLEARMEEELEFVEVGCDRSM